MEAKEAMGADVSYCDAVNRSCRDTPFSVRRCLRGGVQAGFEPVGIYNWEYEHLHLLSVVHASELALGCTIEYLNESRWGSRPGL